MGCTWVDSSCPGGGSCWCVSASTSSAGHCYRCTVVLPRRARDVGGAQPFTKTTPRPPVIGMVSHTAGPIRSGVESWLYNLLPVILCASFFSATYSGRMLPPRFPGRIQREALGLVDGGGGDGAGEGSGEGWGDVVGVMSLPARAAFLGGATARLERWVRGHQIKKRKEA